MPTSCCSMIIQNVKMGCCLMSDCVPDPFFFSNPTVTKEIYLIKVQFLLFLNFPIGLAPKQCTPPHWGKIVKNYLNKELPGRHSLNNISLL